MSAAGSESRSGARIGATAAARSVSTSQLQITGLRARHGNHEVLNGVDLVVEPGQIVAVLGPSGCGKTTLLRVIAGHHKATGGEVIVNGRHVVGPGVHLPPERRSVTIVPQEGGLFPHLDVASNIGFGVPRRDRAGRVAEMVDLVGLQAEVKRRPHQISGGQQQRAALARALAPRPQFVLLDEPFSALDAQLREELRSEVKALLRAERATAILVTHDQAEALALGDSVALMRDGRIVQQSTPSEVYHRPVDAWSARFLGDSLLLDVQRAEDGRADTILGPVPVSGTGSLVLVRPDQLGVSPQGTDVTVQFVEFRGAYAKVTGELSDGTRIVAHLVETVNEGDVIRLAVTGQGWLLER